MLPDRKQPLESLRPLPLFLPPFVAGICLASAYGHDPAFFTVSLCLLVLSGLASLLAWRGGGHLSIFLLSACSFFLAAGALYHTIYARALLHGSSRLMELADEGGRHIISALVIRAPVKRDHRIILILQPLRLHISSDREEPLSGRLSLSVSAGSGWRAGDILRFAATLKRVRNFNTPGSFDYENWWALRGVVVKAFAPSPVLVARTGHVCSGPGISSLRCIMENARGFLMSQVDSGFSKREHGAVASALLFGLRSGITPELSEAFSATGTGHLLAVSGLHMAIIAFLLFRSTRWLLLRRENIALGVPVLNISWIVSMSGVVLYAALAGFSPSATRAMIMILLFMLAFVCELPLSPMNTLAAAAWLLMLISPLYLFDISFQFSFTAVLFLILFAPLVRKLNGTSHGKGMIESASAYFLTILSVSAIALLATAPLVAWYFQRVSVAGIFMNLFLVPLVCFLLLPLLLAGALTAWLFPALPNIFWHFSDPLIEVMLQSVSFASHLPGAWFYVPRPEFSDLVLCYTLFLTVALVLSPASEGRMRRWLAISAIVVAVMLPLQAFVRYQRRLDRNSLILHVLDVGQGLCQVVELPYGRLMVVDAGGMRSPVFDTGKRIVGPYIRSLGYVHIDYLVLSHAERDHGGGMASLVRDFRPHAIWTSDDVDPENPCWRDIAGSIAETGSNHVIFRKDAHVKIPGCDIMVFTGSGCNGLCSRNSRSLVIEFSRFDKKTLLLAGDIDSKREACFVKKNPGRYRVVVVPHHGSRSSSSPLFVGSVKPEIAIFSAGWRNSLGLPAPEVLKRWRNAGARTLVTGNDGTVSVVLERERMKVTVWRWNSMI